MPIATLLIALFATTPGDSTGDRDPLLLDFHSASCGPCRQMRPAIELLVQKGYPVRSVDVEESPVVAEDR